MKWCHQRSRCSCCAIVDRKLMRTRRGRSLQGLHQHLVPQYLVPVGETRLLLIGFVDEGIARTRVFME